MWGVFNINFLDDYINFVLKIEIIFVVENYFYGKIILYLYGKWNYKWLNYVIIASLISII